MSNSRNAPVEGYLRFDCFLAFVCVSFFFGKLSLFQFYTMDTFVKKDRFQLFDEKLLVYNLYILKKIKINKNKNKI
jgi:hypothetical protein